MNKICIISNELPPSEKYPTTADEANENIIFSIRNLKMEIYYIFIDEDRHYYKDGSEEKSQRINSIKEVSNFFQITKNSKDIIKKKVEDIIEQNKLKNFFIFQNCINFIDKKKERKIIMWGIHDNQFPRLKNIYFQKNHIKKLILKIFYFFLNIKDYLNAIVKLNKADIVLQPGRIYFDKWKKIFKKKPRIIFIPQCTRDYRKLVKERLEINFNLKKKNCLLIGQPESSLPAANIKYLCEELIPILEKEKILENFHFYIIGMIHDKLNSDLKTYIQKWQNNITVTGYISDLHSIIYNSDAVIQINPILPVAPTRIYGWSSLSPLLVANEKITVNFPELINKHNCYLGSNRKQYLEIFKKISSDDPQINLIKKNFRKLYDTNWNYNLFINSLIEVFKNFFIDQKLKDKYFN